MVVTDGEGHPQGVVTERDLLRALDEKLASDTAVGMFMSTQVVVLPLSISIESAYQTALREGVRHLVLVDEYGVVQGLLTPYDLLEAITGELQPGQQIDAWATQRDDGSWLLDGMMPVNELKARLDIDDLPDEDRGRYNTLAGLLMAVSGHLPVTGEQIACEGWLFEVVDLDGKRIDKVLARPVPVSL